MTTTIESVMAPATIVVVPSDTVAAARRIMKREKIHALPVVDDYGAPVGIVTSTDLAMRLPSKRRLSRVMTEELVTVGRRSSVPSAARLMRRNRVHHLVVVQAGRVIGVASAFDLLRLLERPGAARTRRATTKRK